MHLYLHLYLYLYLSLSLSHHLYLCLYLHRYLYLHMHLYPYLYLYLHLSLHPSLYLYLRLSLHPSLYRCVPKIGFLEFTRKTNYVDKSALFQNCVGESALFSAEEPPRNRRGTRGIVVYLKSGSWSLQGRQIM